MYIWCDPKFQTGTPIYPIRGGGRDVNSKGQRESLRCRRSSWKWVLDERIRTHTVPHFVTTSWTVCCWTALDEPELFPTWLCRSSRAEITAKRRLMTFTTRQYKTHGGGPVSLFWDEDVRKMAMLYFVHREQRGKPFFLNFTSMDRQASGSEVNGHGKAALRTNCCQSVWEENPSHSQVNTPT